MKNKRLIILSFDGADFGHINPLLQTGNLPTLQSLIKSGVSGELQSTQPPCPAFSWPCLLTGKNPGDLPIIENPRSYEFSVDGSDISLDLEESTLFNVAAATGKCVGLVGFPGLRFSSSRENMNPVSVPLEAKAPPSVEEVKKRLWGRFKNNRMSMFETICHDLREEIGRYFNKASGELKKNPFDLFWLRLPFPDNVCMAYMRYQGYRIPRNLINRRLGRLIDECYKIIDEEMASFLKACDQNSVVIILSPWGVARRPIFVFNLLKWLVNERYLGFKKPNLISLKTIYSKLPPFSMELPPLDGSQTRAFFTPLPHPLIGVSINTIGKYPLGTVTPGKEAQKLADELCFRLKEIFDPKTGVKVFKDVLHRKALFNGDFVERFPEVIAIVDNRFEVGEEYQDDLFQHRHSLTDLPPDAPSGVRTPNGIFIASGPGLEAGVRLDSISILDIMPTALKIIGASPPKGLDGSLIDSSLR